MLPDDKIMRGGDTSEKVFTNNRHRFDGEGPQSGQANPKLYTRWIQFGLDVYF